MQLTMAANILLSVIIVGCLTTTIQPATTPAPLCPYPTLANGLVQCSSDGTTVSCTGVCNNGYIFDIGAKAITKICDESTGVWNQAEDFPACVTNQCMDRLVVTVNDSAITASSSWSALRSYKFGAERGRLDSQVETIGAYVYSAGWRAGKNTLDQYIQVELNSLSRITGVVTQGRSVLEGDTADEYVTQYRVLYSTDGANWFPYSSLTVNDQFLPGNLDRDTARANILSCSFDAKYVRINPLAWHENIAMRFELLGCAPDNTKTSCRLPTTTTLPPSPNTDTTTTTTEMPTTEIDMAPTPTAAPNLCSALPPTTNGIINCEPHADGTLVCVARCNDGYAFESKELFIKKVCTQSTGLWDDASRLPRCIANTTPMPTTDHSTGCLKLEKECDAVGNGDFQACGGCHFFASCSESYLYVRACPEALLFDAISGVCDYHSRTCPT